MNFSESVAYLRKAILCDLPFETDEYDALEVVVNTAKQINDLPLYERLLGKNEPNAAFDFLDRLNDWASVNFIVFKMHLPYKPSYTRYDTCAVGPIIDGYGPTVLVKSHTSRNAKLDEWVKANAAYGIGMISHGKVFLYAEMDGYGEPEPFYDIINVRDDRQLIDFKLRFC